MLPRENSIRRLIARRERRLLAVGKRAQEVALSALQRPRARSSPSARFALLVTLGLLTKCVHTHRAVELVARSGLASEAHALMRTLFETMVALRFVTRKNLSVPRVGVVSQYRRALMYAAHHTVEIRKGLDGMGGDLGNHVKVINHMAPALGELGILVALSNSYSGMKDFGKFCKHVDFGREYAALYRPGSWGTHATDGANFAFIDGVRVRAHVAPGSADACVDTALSSSTAFLVMALRDSHLGMGVGTLRAIDGVEKALVEERRRRREA